MSAVAVRVMCQPTGGTSCPWLQTCRGEVEAASTLLTEGSMIRRCTEDDVTTIDGIVNEAAAAYRGVIPADCWHEPYMKRSELLAEIAAGVEFWGWDDDGTLVGVMGLQKVSDVTLIRHAYV